MTNGKADILIVEDEKSIREALSFSLQDKYNLFIASNGKKALEIATSKSIDLALLDIRLPEINGMDVLKHIKEIDSSIPVIMITAVKTVESAVSAMKLGAYDYIIKPFDIHELMSLIEKALEKRSLIKENVFLKEEIEKAGGFEKIIGKSEKINDIFKLIKNVAKSDSTVLITGESGTGKELVARAIHNQSDRANKLFVPVNCAAIPENLLESELFGYEKGAFTGAFERHLGKFEIAHFGTIFLDEIGLLPVAMQAKLLRVLQEHNIDRVGGSEAIKINVRVIAATNSDLKFEVEGKKFRSDLYYRLNVIPIHIPPLRERVDDIPLLMNHFMAKYNKEFGRSVLGFSKDAMEALKAYPWPGNIRELENLIERLVVLTDKEVITNEKLPPEISKSKSKLQDIIKEHTAKFEMDFIKQIASKINLNARQMQALECIKNEGKITKQGYIKLTNSTKTTAFRDLNSLVKLHILEQKGTGKSSFYTLP
jgi:two-component system, NtrC family, response regulator AtoC